MKTEAPTGTVAQRTSPTTLWKGASGTNGRLKVGHKEGEAFVFVYMVLHEGLQRTSKENCIYWEIITVINIDLVVTTC